MPMQCYNCRKLINSTYDSETGFSEPAHCGAVTDELWARNELFATEMELTAFAFAENDNCPYHDPIDVSFERDHLEAVLMLCGDPQVEIVYADVDADDYLCAQSDFAFDADRENRLFGR